jgi:hypothetical protein
MAIQKQKPQPSAPVVANRWRRLAPHLEGLAAGSDARRSSALAFGYGLNEKRPRLRRAGWRAIAARNFAPDSYVLMTSARSARRRSKHAAVARAPRPLLKK